MSEISNKKVLVEVAAEKLEVIKKDVTVAVEAVLGEIIETLSEGGKVDTSGFGKFKVSERPAHVGISPVTRELLEIVASKAPRFKTAKALKETVGQ